MRKCTWPNCEVYKPCGYNPYGQLRMYGNVPFCVHASVDGKGKQTNCHYVGPRNAKEILIAVGYYMLSILAVFYLIWGLVV